MEISNKTDSGVRRSLPTHWGAESPPNITCSKDSLGEVSSLWKRCKPPSRIWQWKVHTVIMGFQNAQGLYPRPEVATVVQHLSNLPNNGEFDDSHILGGFRVLYLAQWNCDFQIRESLEQCSYNGKLIMNIWQSVEGSVQKTISSSARDSHSAMHRCSPYPYPNADSAPRLRCMSKVSGLEKTSSSRFPDWVAAIIPSPALMGYNGSLVSN